MSTTLSVLDPPLPGPHLLKAIEFEALSLCNGLLTLPTMSLARRHEQVLTPGGFGCPDSGHRICHLPEQQVEHSNKHPPCCSSHPCERGEAHDAVPLLEARQVPDNGDPPLVRAGALQYRKP